MVTVLRLIRGLLRLLRLITSLIQTARHVNDGKSRWVVEQVKARAAVIESDLRRPARIGCFGLAFKPDVDDLRELALR